MSLPLNILWLICGGFSTGIGYILGGLLICLSIIGIPFGLQLMKLGAAVMTPFGKELVESPFANNPLSLVLIGYYCLDDRLGSYYRCYSFICFNNWHSVCMAAHKISPISTTTIWARSALIEKEKIFFQFGISRR